MQSSAVVTASTSTVLNSRGSLTQPACSLCTLRSAGYPASTQHSVPAGGQPLPGGIGDPPGRSRGFPSVLSAHLILPLQASPGATQLLTISLLPLLTSVGSNPQNVGSRHQDRKPRLSWNRTSSGILPHCA